MKSRRLSVSLLVILMPMAASLQATLVTPPTIDWVSIPSSATVNQTVNVSAGAHANASDNSDGNDWNATQMVVAYIKIELQRPGQGWTTLCDWLSPWQTPATNSASFTVNTAGTHNIRVHAMDGRPWFSPTYNYTISVPTPAPSITSQLGVSVNQGQSVTYNITATSSPTSYDATNVLPTGLSVNTSTGAITGSIPTNSGVAGSNSTVNTTITATNSVGTDTKTLVWTITAASITTNASVSSSLIADGSSVTLTRDGTSNFGIAWTENVIWQPNSGADVLGNKPLGVQNYAPGDGPGLYHYQFRIVDTYYNYKDQWITFTVTLPIPTGLQATNVQSYHVDLSWNAVSAAAGYNLYRDGVKVNTTLITGTTYTDSTVAPGTTYAYTIRSVTSGGIESADSSTANVTSANSFEIFTPLSR